MIGQSNERPMLVMYHEIYSADFSVDKVILPTLQSGPSSESMNPGMHKQKCS